MAAVPVVSAKLVQRPYQVIQISLLLVGLFATVNSLVPRGDRVSVIANSPHSLRQDPRRAGARRSERLLPQIEVSALFPAGEPGGGDCLKNVIKPPLLQMDGKKLMQRRLNKQWQGAAKSDSRLRAISGSSP